VTNVVDYALVGGGLQNGLIALALRTHRPNATIAMIERGDTVGGNHTWCFHADDVPAWIEPAVVARWPGYDVAFASRTRSLATPYACVTSPSLARRVRDAVDQLLVQTTAEHVADTHVVTSRGVIEARVVIDARGPAHTPPCACGWQKFLGQEVTLAAPHHLDRPILIDATLPQRDGFRFMYVLPLAPDRLLIEDTFFSDAAVLDAEWSRQDIGQYARSKGWQIAEVEREETGALPMPWAMEPPVPRMPISAGYAGGWFHPVTGYSFPIAARLATLVATTPIEQLPGAYAEHCADHARQLAFAQRLTKMLFRWFAAEHRHHVLARFYRLSEAAIRRFYALELTALDRARIFAGPPPRGVSWRAVFGLESP
jgi:lycopene beta-cyclase